MFYFQSVNTSDSTSFKQRRKEEKLKVEIARTEQKQVGESGKAGTVNASLKARSTEI